MAQAFRPATNDDQRIRDGAFVIRDWMNAMKQGMINSSTVIAMKNVLGRPTAAIETRRAKPPTKNVSARK